MSSDSIKNPAFGFVKIFLLAAAVLIGFVFMPQDAVYGIERTSGRLYRDFTSYARSMAGQRFSEAADRFYKEASRTRAELNGAYLNAKQEVNQWLGSKIKEETAKKIDEILKTKPSDK
jgi:hypothetical protein